jgi:hypothetical protein
MTRIIQTEHFPIYLDADLDEFVANLILLHAKLVNAVTLRTNGTVAAHPLDLVPPVIERPVTPLEIPQAQSLDEDSPAACEESPIYLKGAEGTEHHPPKKLDEVHLGCKNEKPSALTPWLTT